jgi:hypothetical protein
MKKFFLLSLSVIALVPAVTGSAAPTQTSASGAAQSNELSPELLQALKAQAGSTLSRPL